MSAEQLQCHNLLKLLRKPGVRSLSDDRNTVMEAAAKTLKAAKKWPSEGDRMLAADTLERVYDTLGWGSAEKEDQRRTAIDQMRAKQD